MAKEELIETIAQRGTSKLLKALKVIISFYFGLLIISFWLMNQTIAMETKWSLSLCRKIQSREQTMV